MKKTCFFLLAFISLNLLAQTDSIVSYALDSVHLTQKIRMQNAGKILYFPNSDTETLSSLIENHSAVFIREYGRGMLAGISLRGTGTSHTQVVWNGIPVNSILNGQTDLNTLNAGMSNLQILKGGNSTTYGSGAIGGVILLENPIDFKKKRELNNVVSLGSYTSLGNNFKFLWSNNKVFTQVNWHIEQSENDYPFVGFEVKNENGAFQNTGTEMVLGYKINRKNRVYFKQNITGLNRLLARSLYMPSQSKLLQKNHRNLLGWQYDKGNFRAQTDLAYLFESYDYYFNKNTNDFSRSIGNVYMAKNRLKWQFSPQKSLLLGNEFTYQECAGENIPAHHRKLFATYVVWRQQIKKLNYQLALRQAFNRDWQVPLTGSLDVNYQLNKHHSLQAKASRNFRLPTFNDLYWNPGGNPDLEPEKSINLDAGYSYKTNEFSLHVTGFYIHSTDLIKWTPETAQIWTPKNFEEVNFSGVEVKLHRHFILNTFTLINDLEYTYQKPVNQLTNKLLPYTPNHIWINNLRLYYKHWTLVHSYRYQGKMFTTTSNTNFLPAYQIHHLSLLFRMNKNWQLQGNINNIFNVYYESFPTHPQPGRNYQFIINYKIT